MIQIHPNLFLGSDADAKLALSSVAIVHAAKEPYHRKALGYTGRAAEKSHPEYLFAERTTPEGGARLILNLVDAPDPRYISPVIVDKAIEFIDWHINPRPGTLGISASEGNVFKTSCTAYSVGPTPVLVHCNEGHSRCSLIGMLYLAHIKALPESFSEAESKFRGLYPPYQPNAGVHGFLRTNYAKYRNGE